MARTSSRRARFRSGKFARKQYAWFTTTVNDFIKLSEDGAAPGDDSCRRLLLLQNVDWLQNDSLSETATLVRVICDLTATIMLNPGADVGSGQGTWLVHQPCIAVLSIFDNDDVFGDTGGATFTPRNPEYYVENKIMKMDSFMLSTSGSLFFSEGVQSGFQDTAGLPSSRQLGLSTKLRKKLTGQDALGLEYTWLDPAPDPDGSTNIGFWVLRPSSMATLGQWTVQLTGSVRCLIQYG